MKHHRNLDTLAIDIVQSLHVDDDRIIWEIIHLLERNIEFKFNAILGSNSRNSPELSRIIKNELGYVKAADAYHLIYEKLRGSGYRLLRRFDEEVMISDFKGWKRPLDYNNHFLLFCRDVLAPRTLGHAIIAEKLSAATKAILVNLNRIKGFDEKTRVVVCHDLKNVFDELLREVRLLELAAFKEFGSRADFLSRNLKVQHESVESLLSENWQVFYAAYPKGFTSIRGKTRAEVHAEDFDVNFFAARLIAGCRPCDVLVASYLTEAQKKSLVAFGRHHEVAKYIAMFHVCHELNELLKAGVMYEAHRAFGLDHDQKLFERFAQAFAALDASSPAYEQLSLMQNRHLLERAFAEHIYSRSAKFVRWASYRFDNIFNALRRAAQRREKASPFQPLAGELTLDHFPSRKDVSIEEDIVIEILQGSCALGSHPHMFLRLLCEKYLFGFRDEETVQRFNDEGYVGAPWNRRKVIETRKEALECVGRYMFQHYQVIINRLINRYPNKALRVLCIDRVPSTAFTCPDSEDNFYLFSGYTDSGETVVLPCCEKPNLKAALEWLLAKGFHGVRWVISDDFEDVQAQALKVFPAARWQYCHFKIREALSYKRTKKEVMKIISAATKIEAKELLEKHKASLVQELNFTPDLLLQALNYLDLQFVSDTGERQPGGKEKEVYRGRSRFKSTRIYNIQRKLGIKKAHTRMQVHGNLEMYLAGKRFISTNAHKVRMPVWDSSK